MNSTTCPPTRLSLAVTLIVSVMLLSGCLTSPRYGQLSVQGRHANVSLAFSQDDLSLIHSYYGRKQPHGLAKKGKLPPGHRKHLAKKGYLPPGLHGDRLPARLERRLAPLPEGYIRVRVGSDIVLMDGRSRLIFDIVRDIAL